MSEENVLSCDVPQCQAQLSLVNDVPRALHHWGRISDYTSGGVQDYDLCAAHYGQLQAVLGGRVGDTLPLTPDTATQIRKILRGAP